MFGFYFEIGGKFLRVRFEFVKVILVLGWMLEFGDGGRLSGFGKRR